MWLWEIWLTVALVFIRRFVMMTNFVVVSRIRTLLEATGWLTSLIM